ncbi:MAG: hypothetical protein ACE15D_11455 [Candidatus Eisenbacteria bacterium]
MGSIPTRSRHSPALEFLGIALGRAAHGRVALGRIVLGRIVLGRVARGRAVLRRTVPRRSLGIGRVAIAAALAFAVCAGIAAPAVAAEPATGAEAPNGDGVDSTSIGRGKGFDRPFWVMMRSAVIPGWGQAHNGQWLKAVLFGGAESAFLYGIVREDDLRWKAWNEGRYDDADEHAGLKRDYLWWGAFTLLLSLGDAYVDAHLKGFDAEFRQEDEAILLSFEVRL